MAKPDIKETLALADEYRQVEAETVQLKARLAWLKDTAAYIEFRLAGSGIDRRDEPILSRPAPFVWAAKPGSAQAAAPPDATIEQAVDAITAFSRAWAAGEGRDRRRRGEALRQTVSRVAALAISHETFEAAVELLVARGALHRRTGGLAVNAPFVMDGAQRETLARIEKNEGPAAAIAAVQGAAEQLSTDAAAVAWRG